ncbi:hypothetical protein CLV98_105260 [Dyadobacter jejuensis]|uniref:Uncharacterized protein n=1 Tax=Dyadobacter jejuensis TaxID=1082580 RepID=A0A316AL22_9BACT|nr:hypothetical protein CLV98_105260 [Dyadobacter jejuensis]
MLFEKCQIDFCVRNNFIVLFTVCTHFINSVQLLMMKPGKPGAKFYSKEPGYSKNRFTKSVGICGMGIGQDYYIMCQPVVYIM